MKTKKLVKRKLELGKKKKQALFPKTTRMWEKGLKFSCTSPFS